MLAYLRRSLQDFVADRSGAIGVIAVGAIPVLTLLVGAAIDYARVEDVRARLQKTADAAVLATAQAQVLDYDDAEERGDALVDANMELTAGVEIVTRDIQSKGAGHATARLVARVDTFFLTLVGISTLDVEVFAEAKFDTSSDIQITVLLDNSGSMLIGASPADIAGFESLFGCAFACHMPLAGGWGPTYEQAKSSGYETRLQVARDAVLRAFEIVDQSEYAQGADAYFDIYTFAYGLDHVVSGTAAELNGSGGSAVASIEPAPYVDTPDAFAATDYDAAFTIQSDVVAKAEQETDRQHFLLFVTDGVGDHARPNRVIEPFDPSLCDAIKAAGVRIGVIYTTYFDIPNESFWVDNVKPFSDEIGPNLSECASPGWYFEAEYADDVDAAFSELLKLVLPRPQLTQ